MFKGSGVALVTPFTKENNINYTKLEELINMHIQNKTDAIIVCGTTGESSTLSNDEKKELINFSVKIANGKIPIIAGTGSNNTKIAIEMTKYAKKVGANGALVVTPYYNKCNMEGLYEHYLEIANAVSDFPIILYNVPSRTGVNISVDTIKKLSKIKNIVGLKEASPDISRIINIRNIVDENFLIYSGNDDLILPILSVGGSGVISVLANILPNEVHDICYEYFDGNSKTSKNLFFKIFDLAQKLFIDVNPIMIKECMNILEYDVGKTRLPLTSTSKENIDILLNTLKNIEIKTN